MIEMICTFMLVMIVLVTKTARLSPTKEGLLGAVGVVFVLLALT
jgi:glycerol uptake facilitator-like aquaporin